MKIAFCAGGTGGHIYPALCVASYIKADRPGTEIFFFSSGKEVESSIYSNQGFEYVAIHSSALKRTVSFAAIKAVFLFFVALVESVFILARKNPDCLVSTGGYLSLACCTAAYLLRTPIVIHEQNSIPGLVTRITSRIASKKAVSFEETKAFLRGAVFTGNPVRKEILNAKRDDARKHLDLDRDKKVVLVVGGSQGAMSINRAVVGALSSIDAGKITIVHVTGQADYENILSLADKYFSGSRSYRVIPYANNMETLLAASDLVVGRAGASILAEIAARGLPSILIPYPFSASQHQLKNARIFESHGAAVLLQNSSLSPGSLSDLIRQLLGDNKKLSLMSNASKTLFVKDADQNISELIYEAI